MVVTKNTGTQGLYSVSSSSSGSRCGHKQAAQGPASLNGREQKQEASSLCRVRAGSARRGSSCQQKEGRQHGWGGGAWQARDGSRQTRHKCAGRAEVRMNARGLGALGLLGRAPESLAGAWPGRQDTRPGGETSPDAEKEAH